MLLDLLGLWEEGAAAVETLSGRARRLVRPFRAPQVQPGKPLPQPARPERPAIAAWKKLTAGRAITLASRAGIRTGGQVLVTLRKAKPATVPVADQPAVILEQRIYGSPTIRRAPAAAQAQPLQFGRMPGQHLVMEAQAGMRTGGLVLIDAYGLAEREDEELLAEIA